MNAQKLIEAANSNGVYSLRTGWLKEPNKEDIPDTVDLEPELSEWLRRANECKTIEDIDSFVDDIYKLRQESLLSDGEYGKGNQIFKELRNREILKDLKERKVELETQDMSLESLEEDALNEASADKQKFIDKFGQEAFDTFWNNKQRLKSKGISVDILYHVKNTSPEQMQAIVDELNSTLSKSKQVEKEKREGVDVLYEDSDWLVIRIKTYDAAKRYCKGTVWCIAGNYRGYETRGQEFFNDYLRSNYKEYILYIDKKHNAKFMACTNRNDPTTADVWFLDDTLPKRFNKHVGTGELVKEAPKIQGLPDVRGLITDPSDITNQLVDKLKTMHEIPPKFFYDEFGDPHKRENFDLRIPDNIEAIGKRAFFMSTRLISVYVPNSVTYIGDDAFKGCIRLKQITLPSIFGADEELKRIGINPDRVDVALI